MCNKGVSIKGGYVVMLLTFMVYSMYLMEILKHT